MDENERDETQCERCGYPYTLRPDCEPTRWCDECAQDLAAESTELRDLAATLSASVLDVARERRRQIDVKGYTAEHDDRNGNGELATAGGIYAIETQAGPDSVPFDWPWDDDFWKPSKDRRRNLIKAAALIVAEIDRIDRARAASISHLT